MQKLHLQYTINVHYSVWAVESVHDSPYLRLLLFALYKSTEVYVFF